MLDGVRFFPSSPFASGASGGGVDTGLLAEHLRRGLASGPGGVFAACGRGSSTPVAAGTGKRGAGRGQRDQGRSDPGITADVPERVGGFPGTDDHPALVIGVRITGDSCGEQSFLRVASSAW